MLVRGRLNRHFCRVVDLGFMTPTRRLFVAYKKAVELDLSGPLPLLHDPATLLASRWLTSWGSEHFWSRVYDVGDAIVKQASFDLGSREARFLKRLECALFPRVLEASEFDGYSTVRIEKIDGMALKMAIEELRRNRDNLQTFLAGCLDILEVLKNGIRHRDIHADNILVRASVAGAAGFCAGPFPTADPYISATLLGELEHACDVVGMGNGVGRIFRGT